MERGTVQTRTGAASAKKKSLFQKTDRAQRPGPREESHTLGVKRKQQDGLTRHEKIFFPFVSTSKLIFPDTIL